MGCPATSGGYQWIGTHECDVWLISVWRHKGTSANQSESMPAVIYFLHWCIVFTILIFWYNLKPINIDIGVHFLVVPWWRHQMETFSAKLAFCARNSPITGEFTAQRPVTRSFDVFFDLCLNKRLSKQSWGWWFETLLRPFWRHCNARLVSVMAWSWTYHLSLPDYMVPRSMDS